MFGKKQQQPGGGPERFREENIGKKIAGGNQYCRDRDLCTDSVRRQLLFPEGK